MTVTTNGSEPSGRRSVAGSGVAAIFALGFLMFLPGGAAAAQASRGGSPGTPAASRAPSEGERKLGIEIEALRISGGGNLLDLRYRVVAPDKARECLGHGVKPFIEDPVTCARLVVPTMPYVGALRQTAVEPEAGRVYFILFGNAGRQVRRGGKVTVVIGDVDVEDVVVQ
jgi:hypothetical protein